ncbi:hypothetical protein RvY_08063 [Ramazzottius varieornatus]|uniref:Uncharacterized protein n=1 Tax=Ramazzottius varieornatus TaxID=947166 RepID=A0A1D1V795_RAMVA|nr:hypothetical protein RvY_08063 [Ramazzottius varieornatus]
MMDNRQYRIAFQLVVSVGLLIASVLCQGPAVTAPTTRNPVENTTQASNTTQRPSSNAIDTAKDVVANSSMTGQVKTSGNGALILRSSNDGENKTEIVLANVTAVPILAPNGTLVKSNTTGLNATDLADDVILTRNKTSKVVVVPVDTNNKTNRVNQVIVQLNHRIELEPIDFQMNYTKKPKLNLNIVITTLITAGSIPVASIARRKQTLGARAATGAVTDIAMDLDNGDIVMAHPETTTGVQLLFNGTYRNVADDNSDNKVPVPRTFFLDLCGSISDKAFMQIVIGGQRNDTFICAVNLAFPTAARDTEAEWTEPLQCENTNGDWSYRLWYKLRQYNINWSQCQQNRPVILADSQE